MDKTLSIIIPCYNVEKYIEECLESVCNDRDADIEVICVNDGSTDGTLDILEQWKQKDARVIVINQENKGVSVARNQGLHIAKGKFIYFLDSDDKVKDVAILEKCCEKMQEDQLDILIGAGKSFFETEEFYKKYSYYEKSYRIEHEYPRIMKGTELMAELQRNGEWAVQQSTRIYRRKFLQDNNVYYTEGQLHEDNYVTFMCMYLTDRTTAVKDVLFERRIRENSIMTQKVTHKNVEGYLVNFVQDRDDLSDEYIEYVDDGYSGTNFERPAFKRMIEDAKTGKIDTIIVKTQGFIDGNIQEGEQYPVRKFRELLALYKGINRQKLRENLREFLKAVMPVCDEYGVNLCIHPDDPPFQVLGLPRIVTSEEDIDWLLNAVDNPHNGLTFCAGSLSSGSQNDTRELARRFARRTHFVHLRSTEILPEGDFRETSHLEGRGHLLELIRIFEKENPGLPMRVDHGRTMLGDEKEGYNPGYSFYGRMFALAQVEGMTAAVRDEMISGMI